MELVEGILDQHEKRIRVAKNPRTSVAERRIHALVLTFIRSAFDTLLALFTLSVNAGVLDAVLETALARTRLVAPFARSSAVCALARD